MKNRLRTRLSVGVIGVVVVIVWLLAPEQAVFKQAITWQRLVEPGALSAAHMHLEDKCAACHTSVRGVLPVRCITCHANDEAVLRRQPTSFHASISSCVECHLEHQGRSHRPTHMDHVALAEIAFRQLNVSGESEDETAREQLLGLVRSRRSVPSHLEPTEWILNCATCHANDDRHFSLFGSDCAQCHGSDRWTIPEYRHPAASSMDCAQCHQGPPSHYMMHFKMISARVAGKPKARVDQCFQCHQTTSWNDILGVGWYKHH